MSFSEDFKQSMLSINEKTIVDCSLEAFDYQFHTNQVYREYCNYLKVNPKTVKKLTEIPFLPIEFFKNHAVKSGEWKEKKIFRSSGTTDEGRSKHFIKDLDHYHTYSKSVFEKSFGSLSEIKIIALLPSYLEQGDSSLISMVDYFMSYSADGSGYFIGEDLTSLLENEDPKIFIGVSFAFLDLLDKSGPITSQNCIVIETGGMKGRRREIIRNELHQMLKDGFSVNTVFSEYGMTELQSQAYGENGIFHFPPWAKCLIRDINDPFAYLDQNKTGGINVIDLANIDSCCFIETKDLGRTKHEGFEVLGRFDNSDIRGCNLMI
ncbi:LuxE/PaaK family acyltransferase [Ekhidna sp.]